MPSGHQRCFGISVTYGLVDRVTDLHACQFLQAHIVSQQNAHIDVTGIIYEHALMYNTCRLNLMKYVVVYGRIDLIYRYHETSKSRKTLCLRNVCTCTHMIGFSWFCSSTSIAKYLLCQGDAGAGLPAAGTAGQDGVWLLPSRRPAPHEGNIWTGVATGRTSWVYLAHTSTSDSKMLINKTMLEL